MEKFCRTTSSRSHETKYWCQNGLLHRKDGPAIEYDNGDKFWYYYGKEIVCKSQQEFEKLIKLRAFSEFNVENFIEPAADKRNILDKYKGLPTELIRKDIQDNSLPFSFLMQQIQGDFNISNILRSGNALGMREAFYIGKRHWDRRGSCGSYHYLPLQYLSSLEQLKDLKKKYTFIALENNTPKTKSLMDFVWPKNPMIIIGEESIGISPEILELADCVVEIPHRGSIRSMNAASAASIAMWDYVTKLNKK